MFGEFAEIVAVVNAIEHVVGLLAKRRNFRRVLLIGVDENFAQDHLLGPRELVRVVVVIFRNILVSDDDARANFAANGFLREELGPDVVLVVFVIHPGRFDFRFQVLHRSDVVLLADIVESLHDIGLDVDVHVLRALDQKGLVNQIAQCVGLLRVVLRLNLLRRASGAGLANIVHQGVARVLQIGGRNDFVVHARDNFLDDHRLSVASASRRTRSSGRRGLRHVFNLERSGSARLLLRLAEWTAAAVIVARPAVAPRAAARAECSELGAAGAFCARTPLPAKNRANANKHNAFRVLHCVCSFYRCDSRLSNTFLTSSATFPWPRSVSIQSTPAGSSRSPCEDRSSATSCSGFTGVSS